MSYCHQNYVLRRALFHQAQQEHTRHSITLILQVILSPLTSPVDMGAPSTYEAVLPTDYGATMWCQQLLIFTKLDTLSHKNWRNLQSSQSTIESGDCKPRVVSIQSDRKRRGDLASLVFTYS